MSKTEDDELFGDTIEDTYSTLFSSCSINSDALLEFLDKDTATGSSYHFNQDFALGYKPGLRDHPPQNKDSENLINSEEHAFDNSPVKKSVISTRNSSHFPIPTNSYMSDRNSAMAVDGFVSIDRNSTKDFREKIRAKKLQDKEGRTSITQSLVKSLIKENLDDKRETDKRETDKRESFLERHRSTMKSTRAGLFEPDLNSDIIPRNISHKGLNFAQTVNFKKNMRRWKNRAQKRLDKNRLAFMSTSIQECPEEVEASESAQHPTRNSIKNSVHTFNSQALRQSIMKENIRFDHTKNDENATLQNKHPRESVPRNINSVAIDDLIMMPENSVLTEVERNSKSRKLSITTTAAFDNVRTALINVKEAQNNLEAKTDSESKLDDYRESITNRTSKIVNKTKRR